MALTESNMLPLGTIAPAFELLDTVSDKMVSLNQLKSDKATVVIFSCNHCPYVIHINKQLVKLANKYIAKGVSFVVISSNDVENYPADAPDKMKVLAAEEGYPFPYLYDENQEVAKAYDAACTPDFYVFDGALKLSYRGRFCASRPKTDVEVTGADLAAAIDVALNGATPLEKQYPSAGCNIKWKK